ncbi:Thioredoxin domain [Dillenia turbinata]|uniref:Thioredoxin domain n=1 Tax=Dillenia turbinata TaxID=194707 RepID=A0AAN8V691_9MAGN
MGSILSALRRERSSSSSSSSGGAEASSEPSRILVFHSAEQWKQHLHSSKDTSKLMVIDFFASWCGPCRYMEPILKGFSVKFTDVDFVQLDVDELSDVAQEFGVQAMPTFVLMQGGNEIDRMVGAKKDELERKIEMNRSRHVGAKRTI